MDRAVEGVSNKIKIVSTSRSTFSISYSARNGQFAQTFTKRIVETLIQSSNTSRKKMAVETDQFLDEQLRQAKQAMTANEEKLKQFKTAHLGALPEQSSANLNALNQLNSQLVAVENTLQRARDQQKLLDFRAQQQKRLGGLLSQNLPLPDLDLHAENAGTDSPNAIHLLLAKREEDLASLRTRYTAGHPDVIRLTKEVEELKQRLAQKSQESDRAAGEMQALSPTEGGEKINENVQAENTELPSNAVSDIETAEINIEAQSIKGEIAKSEKEKNSILALIKAYQAKLNLAPALEQELMSLSRERQGLETNYSNLQNKKFQAQMTENLEENRNSDTYKIIDEANLPDNPAFPDRVQLMMIGLIGGLAMGIGAAFGRELLDTTLGSEDEAAAVLKLPILATISEIPRKEPKGLIKISRMAKSA
jgi:uncharacterized protein involved in exopolysaccharide biosynthesis